MSFVLINNTRGSLKQIERLPLQKFSKAILGAKYDLSLTFVTSKEIKTLNKKYRNINKPTDILSFPLEKKAGQIVMNTVSAREESKNFDMEYIPFIQFLFIHGCLHLKGMTHGSRMESKERLFLKKFKII